jgi:hypothetical protein
MAPAKPGSCEAGDKGGKNQRNPGPESLILETGSVP